MGRGPSLFYLFSEKALPPPPPPPPPSSVSLVSFQERGGWSGEARRLVCPSQHPPSSLASSLPFAGCIFGNTGGGGETKRTNGQLFQEKEEETSPLSFLLLFLLSSPSPFSLFGSPPPPLFPFWSRGDEQRRETEPPPPLLLSRPREGERRRRRKKNFRCVAKSESRRGLAEEFPMNHSCQNLLSCVSENNLLRIFLRL